jgi:hypothetical protein
LAASSAQVLSVAISLQILWLVCREAESWILLWKRNLSILLQSILHYSNHLSAISSSVDLCLPLLLPEIPISVETNHPHLVCVRLLTRALPVMEAVIFP